MSIVGAVREIWRYPVKSMTGERLDSTHVDRMGLRGDRAWAVRDELAGEIRGAKKLPALLGCAASYEDGLTGSRAPAPLVTLPDGVRGRCDDARLAERLSDVLGRRVSLWPLMPPEDAAHYRLAKTPSTADVREQLGIEPHESDPDLSELPLRLLLQLRVFSTPPGTYFDAYPLHILTTASLAALRRAAPEGDFDVRRFRPNVLIETDPSIEGLAEFGWCGGRLRIGEVIVACEARTVRCAMPSLPQARGLERETTVLRTVRDCADRHLGIYANIVRPGSMRVGDEVELRVPRTRAARAAYDSVRTSVKRFALRGWAKISH